MCLNLSLIQSSTAIPIDVQHFAVYQLLPNYLLKYAMYAKYIAI